MARGKSLSREIVLNKAVELAKTDGIDSVTYNRLARELDIRPQSMYRYVSNLKELQVFLIYGFLSEMVEKIENAIAGLEPIEVLRTFAIKFYDEYHENSCYHESFELMHRYEIVNELTEPLSFFTSLIQKQMELLGKSPEAAIRYVQLFMALNIGYTHMEIMTDFPSCHKDNRKMFEQSINEFVDKMILD